MAKGDISETIGYIRHEEAKSEIAGGTGEAVVPERS